MGVLNTVCHQTICLKIAKGGQDGSQGQGTYPQRWHPESDPQWVSHVHRRELTSNCPLASMYAPRYMHAPRHMHNNSINIQSWLRWQMPCYSHSTMVKAVNMTLINNSWGEKNHTVWDFLKIKVTTGL